MKVTGFRMPTGVKIIPPGGLTRYVAPVWGVIDPDQAPVPVPVIFDRD